MISEEAIRFRHPDYDPDRTQKLISSSMSRRLSTPNILSKFVHAFLRQANAGVRAKTYRPTTPPSLSGVKTVEIVRHVTLVAVAYVFVVVLC